MHGWHQCTLIIYHQSLSFLSPPRCLLLPIQLQSVSRTHQLHWSQGPAMAFDLDVLKYSDEITGCKITGCIKNRRLRPIVFV